MSGIFGRRSKLVNIDDLRKKLLAFARIKDPTNRKLVPIGLITSFPEKSKVMPIVYGGMTVEYYLPGSHVSSDIDPLSTDPEKLTEVLCNAGVRRDHEFF